MSNPYLVLMENLRKKMLYCLQKLILNIKMVFLVLQRIFFSGGQIEGKLFLVALVGYEEKDGEWESVDIRIAPGVEKKDFQKFSKVLHIKKDEAEGATGIISKLQKFYEKKLESEKNR